MKASARHSCLLLALTVALTLPLTAVPAGAQQKPPARPSTAKPSTARPSTAKPAPPTAKPAEPVKAPAPPPPPPPDIRFKSVYTNGDMKTESVTYIKGQRERFEFQDMVLLKQPDQKRTIQISKSANTYLVSPDGMPAPGATVAAPAAPPRPPGVIMVATTIVDTGERKTVFGQQARHVKLMIDKQPMPGACDTTRQRIETDGWYIDNPPAIANRPATPEQAPPPSPDGCADRVQATSNGDPRVMGFPIAYTTTLTSDDGKPVVSSMEVTEYELTTLDASLFEVPSGLNAAMNLREMSKALSDANEAKLVSAVAQPVTAPAPKPPGVIRIAVPEFTNRTQQTVDTRALRQRLISDLAEAKFEAVPLPASTPGDAQKRAGDMGADYVLFAEVTELKVNKPSRFGGLIGAAAGVATGRAAAGGTAPPKENTESSLAVRLVQPDGRQRLSTTARGKDGSGFSLKSGLGFAKYAGGMYLGMMAGPMMFSRLASAGVFNNMGGMGMLGNPYLYYMQGAGLSGLGKNIGMDATAGAAAYLMQSFMEMENLGGYVGVPGQGPSFDESLGEAVQNAARAVQKALERK